MELLKLVALDRDDIEVVSTHLQDAALTVGDVHWRPSEKRLVISDYFLNEDNFDKVHAEGDHKVHVARVTDNNLVLDSRFNLDFNTAFSSGPARPHGIAIK